MKNHHTLNHHTILTQSISPELKPKGGTKMQQNTTQETTRQKIRNT
jgi:hypothetical protein